MSNVTKNMSIVDPYFNNIMVKKNVHLEFVVKFEDFLVYSMWHFLTFYLLKIELKKYLKNYKRRTFRTLFACVWLLTGIYDISKL